LGCTLTRTADRIVIVAHLKKSDTDIPLEQTMQSQAFQKLVQQKVRLFSGAAGVGGSAPEFGKQLDGTSFS
jgi:hypothetical protein